MKKSLSFLIALSSFGAVAQSTSSWCATHGIEQQYLLEHPESAAQIISDKANLEAFTQEFIGNIDRTATQNYIIPVVFHILHEGGPENISDVRVHEQIERLNADYNGYNSDTNTIAEAFKPIIGNSNFQFVLAKLEMAIQLMELLDISLQTLKTQVRIKLQMEGYGHATCI